jgi:hypothetical protein
MCLVKNLKDEGEGGNPVYFYRSSASLHRFYQGDITSSGAPMFSVGDIMLRIK